MKKKLIVFVLVIALTVMLASCELLTNFINQFKIGPSTPNDNNGEGENEIEFTEVDLEETLAKFFDGTFTDDVFDGEGIYLYRFELNMVEKFTFLEAEMNMSLLKYREFLSASEEDDEVAVPQEFKMKGVYNRQDNDFAANADIYCFEGVAYTEIKSEENKGKYREAGDVLWIIYFEPLDNFDFLNLIKKDGSVTAETAAEYIEKIEMAEAGGVTYYQFTLNDQGNETFLNSVDNYSILFKVKDNKIIEFSFEASNDENGYSLQITAQKSDKTDIELPDFSEFTEIYGGNGEEEDGEDQGGENGGENGEN